MQPIDLLLFALILVCGLTDIRTGRIYNKATYPAILVGFVWAAFAGQDALISSAEGFLAAAVLMVAPVMLGGMGGGDAKLLAAVGALKGLSFVLDALFYSFLAGGAIALSMVIWQGRLWSVLRTLWRFCYSAVWLRNASAADWQGMPTYKVPFGAAICLGTLWAQVMRIV
jgi:Flp pilus assembly protein protease CpaA